MTFNYPTTIAMFRCLRDTDFVTTIEEQKKNADLLERLRNNSNSS